MSKPTAELCSIARAGGSITISSNRPTADLCSIARAGGATGATLTVRTAGAKPTADLCSIARANPGKVIFEFE